MSQPPPASLFAGKTRIEGAEIRFRAVCALGWAIRQKLSELRVICAGLPQNLNVSYWVDLIETQAIDQFTAQHSSGWPLLVSHALQYLATRPQVAGVPAVAALFNQLAALVVTPKALDPVSQIQDLNRRGFNLAKQLIDDSAWSSALVQSRWARTVPSPWEFREDSIGNFRPVTAMDKSRIELRVNTAEFEIPNALHYYLTLEFQMMHEYISHLVPVWNSGNALEEEFLLAMTWLYYRAHGPHEGLVSLVREADERRADPHRSARHYIEEELAPGSEPRLTQLLLELAVLQEGEMKAAEKRHLLALLKKIPLQEDSLRETVRGWIESDNPLELYAKLKTVIS